jgi:hypothetical protein
MSEILEHFSIGKLFSDSYSEDRLIMTENVIGVFDGAKGPDYLQPNLISKILERSEDFTNEITSKMNIYEFTQEVSKIAFDEKQRHHVQNLHLTGGFFFCLFVVGRNEIWRLGDCSFSVDGVQFEAPLSSEAHISNARATFLKACITLGVSQTELINETPDSQILTPLLRAQSLMRNNDVNDLGFGVIDGQTTPTKFLEVHKVQPNSTIEISTDGYPALKGNLNDTGVHLESLLSSDPLCISENIGPKGMAQGLRSYDDRSYIRFVS